MTDDYPPAIQRALRRLRTQRTLDGIQNADALGIDAMRPPAEFDVELSDLSIHERAERATLDHFEQEAATVVTIADREISHDDLIDLAETVHRAGYDDVMLFHPPGISGIPNLYVDPRGWEHDDMALAVAPEALAQPPGDLPLRIGHRAETVVDVPPAWMVKRPDGVALAKTATTDFEWGEA